MFCIYFSDLTGDIFYKSAKLHWAFGMWKLEFGMEIFLKGIFYLIDSMFLDLCSDEFIFAFKSSMIFYC